MFYFKVVSMHSLFITCIFLSFEETLPCLAHPWGSLSPWWKRSGKKKEIMLQNCKYPVLSLLYQRGKSKSRDRLKKHKKKGVSEGSQDAGLATKTLTARPLDAIQGALRKVEGQNSWRLLSLCVLLYTLQPAVATLVINATNLYGMATTREPLLQYTTLLMANVITIQV